MDTERIDLGNGQWWEIHTKLTRRMEKAVTKASLAAIPDIAPNGSVTEDDIKAKLLSRVGAVDIGAIEDAYLLNGTVTYSFGPIVSMEVIDGLDADVVRRVITRMFELYNPQRMTEGQREGFFGRP